jgi:Domain of unknown function (DUF1844)
MNDTPPFEDPSANASREEMLSALFASMVMQQTNLALMMLGRVPHPETGKTALDIDGARLFIDQLEMLEAKTRGNLDNQEAKLLKQSLTTLRMAFVEAVDGEEVQPEAAPESAPAEAQGPASSAHAPEKSAAPSAEDESRKKFSKKY